MSIYRVWFYDTTGHKQETVIDATDEIDAKKKFGEALPPYLYKIDEIVLDEKLSHAVMMRRYTAK